MQVTNNSQAPQGVHTLGGTIYVMPKETKTLDLNYDQAVGASKLGFFSISGTPVEGEAATATLDTIDIPDNEVDQLRQQLESSTADASRLTEVVADRDAEIVRLNALITEQEAEIENLKAPADNQTGQQQSAQSVAPVGPFEVKDTNPGWFGIFGADGVQVGKSIRATDADAFKALTGEQQLSFLMAASATAAA